MQDANYSSIIIRFAVIFTHILPRAGGDYHINERIKHFTCMNLRRGIRIVYSIEKLHLDQDSYFQEINHRIKILGLFRYDWGNELIVISQNLNIVTVQYFQVHSSRKCFIIAESNGWR